MVTGLAATQVLIVDDNKNYREAFRRNLVLGGYDVAEAEDSVQAMESLGEREPEVVITDLSMRRPTEGLDLIRQVRAVRPHLPIIMISAVGTFDEGAEAMRLGAWRVVSKSRIDEEIDALYQTIDDAAKHHARIRERIAEIERAVASAADDRAGAAASLRAALNNAETPDVLKGEIFDRLAELSLGDDGAAVPELGLRPAAKLPEVAKEGSEQRLAAINEGLSAEIACYAALENDTRQNLRTAEFLFQQSESAKKEVDFSRSMGFAYCFAVENEAKARLRKRLHKFLSDGSTRKLIENLLEPNGRRISIFYQQYLLRALRGVDNEATIENYFHVFQRILEHGPRYKPDGLKALGIILICFGRTYSYRKAAAEVAINNPLGLAGFASPEEALKFAGLLINLQHYRNPYIHPEISEMTKLSQIRETAFACLNQICRLQ